MIQDVRMGSPVRGSALYASQLRAQLSQCSQQYARAHGLAHQLSYGGMPAVVFESAAPGQHGNFLPASYRAILRKPEWLRRLQKAHSQTRNLPAAGRRWRELDSANSSDALLMNIFCCPGVAEDRRVQHRLGTEAPSPPEFGYKPRVPLLAGRLDRTEVDMRFGSLLVEAKLTESDFQRKPKEAMQAYRDFHPAFDVEQLPQDLKCYFSYQLIRNVLAAQALGCSFCVLLDARRPDLLESWFQVMQAIRPAELRVRCKVLTWQELATILPRRLQSFLAQKYGIVAA